MPLAFTEELRETLIERGVPEGAVGELALQAAEEDIAVWPQSRYGEIKGMSKAAAYVAYRTVHEFVARQGVLEEKIVSIPDRPPYLDSPEQYDPTDPAQVWRAPETAQLYRWDGRRDSRHPWGQVWPVMEVDHYLVNGVLVPDPDQARRAIDGGYEWFHKGYGCWIGIGGKPRGYVDRERREAVVRAMETLRERGPLVAA